MSDFQLYDPKIPPDDINVLKEALSECEQDLVKLKYAYLRLAKHKKRLLHYIDKLKPPYDDLEALQKELALCEKQLQMHPPAIEKKETVIANLRLHINTYEEYEEEAEDD